MYTFFENEMAGIPADTLNSIALGVIVFVALLLLYMLYRLIRRPRLASGRRSKQARLAVTDAALIDERRKLVLVRRDDIEHLVLIGGASDLVIESNIKRNLSARPLPTPASAPQPKEPSAPVPVTPVRIPPAAADPASVQTPIPIPAATPKPITARLPEPRTIAIPRWQLLAAAWLQQRQEPQH